MNGNGTPIRVLLIMAGFAVEGPLGGVERMTIALAQALAALEPGPGCRPVQPSVCGLWRFDTPGEARWLHALRAQGIPAFIAYDAAVYPQVSPYVAWAGAARALPRLAGRADVIHCEAQFGDPLALLAKRRLGAQAVVRSVHQDPDWQRRPLRRLLLTHVLYPPAFDAEAGISDAIAAYLDARPLARLLGRKAHVLYNAVDSTRVEARAVLGPGDRAAVRAALGIPANAPFVLAAGRLAEQKGYDLLLEAAARVRLALPDVRFVIAGEGPLRPALEAQRAALGLEEAVLLPGARDDVERLMAACDLFVNCSRWEGLPTAIMEAMVAGAPVLAVALPGNRRLVGDQDERGLLAPAEDAHALAVSLLRGLATPREEWQPRLAAAREFVAANLSITAVARQHAALYNSLVRA